MNGEMSETPVVRVNLAEIINRWLKRILTADAHNDSPKMDANIL